MRNPSNIRELVQLKPDYIGFIFYPKSNRYIGAGISDEFLKLIPESVQKTGVFVDEPFDSLLEKFDRNKLDVVQLHGAEPMEYCRRLKNLNIPVIKTFNFSPGFDFSSIKPYNHTCDYYLFDTASGLRGGSGIKFDWEMLNLYTENKLFFLSGGIQQADVEDIKGISHKELYAVDLNSGFEIEPGIKDILKLKAFIDGLRSQEG